jgi:hypothetical protein
LTILFFAESATMQCKQPLNKPLWFASSGGTSLGTPESTLLAIFGGGARGIESLAEESIIFKESYNNLF